MRNFLSCFTNLFSRVRSSLSFSPESQDYFPQNVQLTSNQPSPNDPSPRNRTHSQPPASQASPRMILDELNRALADARRLSSRQPTHHISGAFHTGTITNRSQHRAVTQGNPRARQHFAALTPTRRVPQTSNQNHYPAQPQQGATPYGSKKRTYRHTAEEQLDLSAIGQTPTSRNRSSRPSAEFRSPQHVTHFSSSRQLNFSEGTRSQVNVLHSSNSHHEPKRGKPRSNSQLVHRSRLSNRQLDGSNFYANARDSASLPTSTPSPAPVPARTLIYFPTQAPAPPATTSPLPEPASKLNNSLTPAQMPTSTPLPQPTPEPTPEPTFNPSHTFLPTAVSTLLSTSLAASVSTPTSEPILARTAAIAPGQVLLSTPDHLLRSHSQIDRASRDNCITTGVGKRTHSEVDCIGATRKAKRRRRSCTRVGHQPNLWNRSDAKEAREQLRPKSGFDYYDFGSGCKGGRYGNRSRIDEKERRLTSDPQIAPATRWQWPLFEFHGGFQLIGTGKRGGRGRRSRVCRYDTFDKRVPAKCRRLH